MTKQHDKPVPPVFSRSPRLNPPLPEQDIEIPAPPAKPSPPRSLWPIILPALLMAGVMMVIALLVKQTSMIFFSAPLMLVSATAAIAAALQQRSDYRRAMAAREVGYRDMLARHETELREKRDKQLELLQKKDPEPEVCLEWVQKLNRNLWTRSPADTDFLEIRLGRGNRPSKIRVKPPDPDHPFAPDELIEAARQLAANFSELAKVPLTLLLRDVGTVGLVGEQREKLLAVMGALVIQLTTHHSPDEVKLVAIYPEAEANQWAWLRWLPHVWDDRHQRRYLASTPAMAHDLLYHLNDILSYRQNQGLTGALPCFVLLLADAGLTDGEPVTARLRTEGPALGAYPIFLRSRAKELPQQCRAIVSIGPESFLGFTQPAIISHSLTPDLVTSDTMQTFATAMAPIRLNHPPSMSDIVTEISLLDMFEAQTIADLDIATRWRTSQDRLLRRTLEVPIGLRAGNERLLIDLHERKHGPNGLVAGMVGAGKSELLQTLVASLAINFHPHHLAFVLIDYKGDATTAPFEHLPHKIGIINNLQEGGMILRALRSLEVEVERRYKLLSDAGVSHIDDYLKRYFNHELDKDGQPLAPLPYLVIIVDEFAELKQGQSDEAQRFIQIARVGRSLGLRMILAMQKPAGVVNDQIEANTRFRLCLRVNSAEDSQAMLKRNDAARLTGVGRAYFQIGLNEVFELFQVAYSGAQYDPEGVNAPDPEAITLIALNGDPNDLYKPNKVGIAPPPDIKQLKAVVEHLQQVAREQAIRPLEPLWLDPLPGYFALAEVASRTIVNNAPSAILWPWTGTGWQIASRQPGEWLNPIIGLLDDPQHKARPPLRIDFGQEGHLSIYGAPRSGKTTLLQTLAISLASSHTPAEVNIYLLDFGGHQLGLLSGLPHVGDIATADDAERVSRLFYFLVSELDRRSKLFGAMDLLEFRRQHPHESMPAIVVMLDNYANFVEAYEPLQNDLLDLARKGSGYGIYLVLTTNSSGDMKFRLSSNIKQTIALSLVDRTEYSALVGRMGDLLPSSKPGRGLIKLPNGPLEFHAALPVAGEKEEARGKALQELIGLMAAAWPGPKAKKFPTLPPVIHLESFLKDMPAAHNSQVLAAPLGQRVADLTTFSVELENGPHFLITGPPQSGKTTLLQTWLLALAYQFSPTDLHLYLFDTQKRDLADLLELPHAQGRYSAERGSSAPLLTQIRQEIEKRRQSVANPRTKDQPKRPALVLALDDAFNPFNSTLPPASKADWEAILNQGRGLGGYVLAASGLSDLSGQTEYNSYNSDLIKPLKSLATFFLLGSNDTGMFGGMRLAAGNRPIPLSEGHWIRHGQSVHIKIAQAQAEGVSLASVVEKIQERWQAVSPVGVTPTPEVDIYG